MPINDIYWLNNLNNSSQNFYPTITTSGTSIMGYPVLTYAELPSVIESPSAPLGDREWLDAQIQEVCDLV